MRLNPEFRRNLWLELSLHRMILLGGALAGVFVLVGVFSPRNVVANVALATFVLAAMAWGSHRAGDSVLDELRERTWDAQRMSALGPWSMTWGKLCGATFIPWFVGVISIGVYLFERQGPTILERLQVVAAFTAGAVLVQALSLIGALIGTRFDKTAKSTLMSWAAVGTLGLLWSYFSFYYRSDDAIFWYGSAYDRFNFLTVSLFALCAWVTFGAYRLMCTELAVATRPWAWTAFVLYLTIYFAGGFIPVLDPLSRSLSVFAAMGLVVSIGLTYISAFALYRDPLAFRRLKHYAETGRWRRFLEAIPIWMASLGAAALFTIACVALHFMPHYSLQRIENVGLTAVPIWFVTLTILALLYYFTYGGSNRRVETTTIICLVLLYWLLPVIIESLGLVTLSWLFRPPMWDRPVLSAFIIGVHFLVAGTLCYRRYYARIAPTISLS